MYSILIMQHLPMMRYPPMFVTHELVLDFDFPIYSITEDFQTGLH